MMQFFRRDKGKSQQSIPVTGDGEYELGSPKLVIEGKFGRLEYPILNNELYTKLIVMKDGTWFVESKF